jgi:hypothetical protein
MAVPVNFFPARLHSDSTTQASYTSGPRYHFQQRARCSRSHRVLRDRLQHSIFLFHSLFIMYTTFSIGTSCIVKNNEYAVPPPGAFHPDIPVHLLCSSTSLVVEHERAGETRVRQRACHFRQAMRAGVPRCGTLLHIYSTATYIFPINHTLHRRHIYVITYCTRGLSLYLQDLSTYLRANTSRALQGSHYR